MVQRTHFINPVYLPALTECFLARDFNFAEYLAIKMSRTVNEHLKTHFVTMINCLPILIFFFLYTTMEPSEFYFEALDVPIQSTVLMNALHLVSLVGILSAFWYLQSDLDNIQKALFPQILLDPETQRRQEEYDELEE